MARKYSVVSTKGGTGKSTSTTNLGALLADAGIRVLIIDLDPVQPTSSSYYPLIHEAPGGIYDLLALNVTAPERIISKTSIRNLDVIVSNDDNNQLGGLLLQAPDGRLRLANLMDQFDNDYDVILIDTQGARSVVLEMVILASDVAISPLPPNMLAAREFNRGTMQMLDGMRVYSRLGMKLPPVKIVINDMEDTVDSWSIYESLIEIFADHPEISLTNTIVPHSTIFRKAATLGLPAHRFEYRQPSNRKSPCALAVFRQLAQELFPEFREQLEGLTEERVAQLVRVAKGEQA
ncbi:ParA family protein [Pseudomonas sp. 21LCFQ02]|uniref:ParA family protein n=1 Tax=Pseudomonas sp. 21LCFQ02 TaxID=2957505 RepID=UPI00209AAC02|nr:ParA family protein [Pseudomonas sp. 21LCFQ02]MCO8171171.1 ParA family protein [Pseudomonas sp. 21LCFQ02]